MQEKQKTIEIKENFLTVSKSDIINIFKDAYNIELCSLSSKELDCFIRLAEISPNMKKCDIGGDMDFDIPIDISQINEWLEFITKILELAGAYMLYSISKSSKSKHSETINETSEEDFYEYVIKEHHEKEFIKGQRNKRRIKTIYKSYKEILSRKTNSK